MAPSRRRVSGTARRIGRCKAPSARQTAAGRRSGLLLVLDVAADDVGDVVALVLVGLEEGVVVGGVVGDLDFLLAFGRRPPSCRPRPRRPPLRAKPVRPRPPPAPRPPAPAARPAQRGAPPARARRRPTAMEHRLALRADDRVLAEVVEFRAATARTGAWYRARVLPPSGILGWFEKRRLTWPLAAPLSIALADRVFLGPVRQPPHDGRRRRVLGRRPQSKGHP